MPEFTGERVIPGEVEVDLLNEHVSRYAFATRLAGGKRVLDAGCGAGYGAAELARVAASVVGSDISAQAVTFAREHYAAPNLWFEQADCTALPHADGRFDLVVAFEVIEHLANWRELLMEARRLLAPGGQFVVSTPNRLYYAESRGAQGANPFHVHEFDFGEFRVELTAVFSHVSLFLENHVEGVAFQAHQAGTTSEVRVDSGPAAPEESHFFVAVCAHRMQLGNPTFVYIPNTANVLRERERHIALLQRELLAKDQWLDEAHRERDRLLQAHSEQKDELARSNQWAQSLDRQLAERDARIGELQQELARSNQWAQSLNQELAGRDARIGELQEELARSNQWAQSLDRELQEERARSNQWAQSLNQELAGRDARIGELQEELARSNQWAQSLNQELAGRDARIGELQAELARSNQWAQSLNGELAERDARIEGHAAAIRELEQEAGAKAQWALDQEARVKSLESDLVRAVDQLHATEQELEQRTEWVRRQRQELDALAEQARRQKEVLETYQGSQWVKLGGKIGLGPRKPAS